MIPLGPPTSQILILADWPEQFDLMKQQPLSVHQSEFAAMLHAAGVTMGECIVACASQRVAPQIKGKEELSSWMSHTKSPKISSWKRWHASWVSEECQNDIKAVHKLIDLARPNVIIALGNFSLFALTGKVSVKKWRGSQLRVSTDLHSCNVVPTYHPRNVRRDYSVRAITVHDLRRAARIQGSRADLQPKFDFLVRPDFPAALSALRALLGQVRQAPLKISIDIETRAGHLACIGFATNRRKAFCIPLMCLERPAGYWSEIEETVLVDLMREIMTHSNAQCFGQNFIYDVQYIWRFWFIMPNVWYDTMNAQHVMFPGQPKGLDYLASMYCEHYIYWKDDGKEWRPELGEDQYWVYNCEDCVRTFEVMEQQWPQIRAMGLYDVWDFQQNKLFPLLVKAMIRGVRADVVDKARLSGELMSEATQRDEWLASILGHPLNIQSPTQMQNLFYTDFGMKPVINRVTGRPTVDDKALSVLAKKEPLLQGLINVVQELRSIKVFRSTFVEARLDRDSRLRSSYNIAGTETFRLSSSENAFGSGLNFQNVPKGNEDPKDPTALSLPNVRKLFLPDEGYTIFDMDLKSADFYTVTWEADDDEFRQALNSGIDIHGLNAQSLFGLSCGVNEVARLHNEKRQLAKIWCHATNYGAGAHNMARACGIAVREAERLRARWFQMHPGIERWHKRAEHELTVHRRVGNRFGYRMVFFDRIEAALPEALAWTPQSTTGCVINRAWQQIATQIPEVEILIQVHDSLVGQFPTSMAESMTDRILQAAQVVVPYERPMVIPAGIKTSTLSWGHCE